jgi:MFS family permease
MCAGLLMVLIAQSESTVWGWASVKTIALGSSGMLILAAWARGQSRSLDPFIDLRTMRIRGVWTTNAVAFLFGLGLIASSLLIPEYAQAPTSTGYGLGVSVAQSGLILLPATLGILVTGVLSATLTRRFGSRPLLLAGLGNTAAAFAILTFERSEIWQIYAASALLGVGEGLLFGVLANLVIDNVPHQYTAAATAVNTVSRILGGALGAQIAASILAASLIHAQPTNIGFTVAFGFCLASSLASLLLARLVPHAGATDGINTGQAAGDTYRAGAHRGA